MRCFLFCLEHISLALFHFCIMISSGYYFLVALYTKYGLLLRGEQLHINSCTLN